MISKFVRKLGQVLFVLAATSFISFALFSFSHDPVDAILGENASVEDRERVFKELGFDRPFLVRYGAFVGHVLTGDLGNSLRSNVAITDLIADRLPATLELVLVAVVLTLSLGIVLGIYTGTHRKGRLSSLILSVSLFGVSFPTFLLGLFGVYIFSVQLGWLPSSGRRGVVDLGWWQTSFLTAEGWSSIIMPATTLAIFNIGLFIRLVRTEVLEIRTMDYIKFAKARGLGQAAISRNHVFPNTLMPVINVGALTVGTMIAFSLITESVFNWPGMGLLFLQSLEFGDFPVMGIYFLFVAVVFVVLNLLADLLILLVDPRVSRKTS